MLNDKSGFNIILKAKAFTIPSEFQYLNDIDQGIFKLLVSQQKYEVKSNVSYEVFQAFINYWLNKEIPDINVNNLFEFDQISQEFDLMKDHIELFKKNLPSIEISHLLEKNRELKKQQKDKNTTLNQITNKYLQIIHILFKNSGTSTYSRLLKYKDKLFPACSNYDVKLVDLFTRKKVKENGLLFALNEETKTAGILQNLGIKNKIFVPHSIAYKSNEYLITDIFENSFNSCKKIKFTENSELKIIDKKAFFLSAIKKILIPSHVTHILNQSFSFCFNLEKIECSENSELTFIGEYAFSNSSINQLTIPSSISEFKNGWCNATPNLNKIKIIENKIQNIKFFDEKFLLGKSDNKSDIFDVLLFARRDIIEASIPPFIKRIASYSFNECRQLKSLNFIGDSKLLIIEKFAFCECSIESISIPEKVIQIDTCAFFHCTSLSNVEFSSNCQLNKIGSLAFFNSNLKFFSITSNLVELKEGWCSSTPYLTKIEIMKNNNNFLYFDKTFILGKSFFNSNIFDVILFANRDLKIAKIPSFIKRIASYSFNDCNHIYKIEFDENSQLKSIGESAFAFSSIKKISIPNKVKQIEKSAFNNCVCLEKVEILKDSKLESIGEFALSRSKISSLFISAKIIQIEKNALNNCKNLRIIEIDENSKLKSFDKEIYQCSALEIIMVPTSLKNKLHFL